MEAFLQITALWLLIIAFVKCDVIPLIEFLTEWNYESK